MREQICDARLICLIESSNDTHCPDSKSTLYCCCYHKMSESFIQVSQTAFWGLEVGLESWDHNVVMDHDFL
jgi:hypothetical protein